ncbi:MAG: GAF domain-containing protein [Spirochaetales bacterium]|nr:GAF domain-containing protein [Spirochaetales bacterium]
MKPEPDYKEICLMMQSLAEGVPYTMTNLANASALLNEKLSHINWVGFYTMKNGQLVLGPFQGKVACTIIPLGKGVCGNAAAQDRTLLVPDVHAFPGHIACDSASNSEIVIPMHRNGEVFGVLDIDSPLFGRFTEKDREGLEAFVRVLENHI